MNILLFFGFFLAVSTCSADQCKDECGPYGKFSECNSLCDPTCANPKPTGACALVCVPGCACNDGAILLTPNTFKQYGQCVPKFLCRYFGCTGISIPPKRDPCEPFGETKECASACAPTCDNRNPTGPCREICVRGCVCKTGAILLTQNTLNGRYGKCIPKFACPQTKCGPNAIESDCASPCPETCIGPTRYCADYCIKGCKCKEGYILLKENGPCIPRTLCPKKGLFCPVRSKKQCFQYKNECCTSKECGKGKLCCEENCGNECLVAVTENNTGGVEVNKPGCTKEPGRDCGPGGSYKNCTSPCAPTCSKPIQNEACIESCDPPGCVCESGFVLDKKGGKCIPRNRCPKQPPNLFCPVRSKKMCIRNQNQCCTSKECSKKGQLCCEENCGYECRVPVTENNTGGVEVNKPGCIKG